MAAVSIRQLDIRLGAATIIRGLDLEVHDGEFLVLLGPSGCGKSTLLHGIAGLTDASGGEIRIDGADVTWADPKDRGIGMVFQSYALYPTMNVERNMSFGLRVAGVGRGEIARRVERAAKMLHLEELLKRKPAQLSGGQRQRVAIGRALVRDARVFLFDEPLSNLDAKLRAELRRELKQLHRSIGATMIYVTHDQVEAMTLASRIAVMRAGQIQQIADPTTIYDRPQNMFVAGFVGSPGMNFVAGTVGLENAAIRFTSPGLELDVSHYPFSTAPVNGQPVVLGTRPEHITLGAAAAGASGTARITLVEPMGPNQIVWLESAERTLAVHAEGGTPIALEAAVPFRIDAGRVSLFDGRTEQRL
jgi:multiple sugar transport system ATP-binding protein